MSFAPFELANSLAQISHRGVFQDFNDCFPNFLHDAANPTSGFVRTGALFIETFADATDRGQGSLDVANNCGKTNFLRGQCQSIATGNAPFALDQPGAPQFIEYLFQKPFGNTLLVRDRLNAHNFRSVVLSQDHQRP